MNCLNRDRSSMLPIPTIRSLENPDTLYAAYAIGSRGFVTGTIIESAACLRMFSTTLFTMPAFIFSRSILVMPGFLPEPATTTTTSEPAISE